MPPREMPVVNAAGDEPARRLVDRLLRDAGLPVTDVRTAAALFDQAEAAAALVVLGPSLDGVPGLDLCRRLKSDPRTRRIPVLYLADAGDAQPAGDDTGPDAYLVLPLEGQAFRAVVDAWRRVRRAEEESRLRGRQLQAIGEVLAEGLCVVDRDGVIREANPAFARLVRRPGADLVGRPLPAVLADGLGPLDELWSAGRRVVREREVDGRRLHLTAEPIRDGNDKMAGGLVVIADRGGRAEPDGRARTEHGRGVDVEAAARERLTVPRPEVRVTARCFGGGLLREASPAEFAHVVGRYAELLNRALDERSLRVSHRVSDELAALGERLGQFGAGPRDVVEIHTAALRARQRGVSPQKAQAYLEEGRVLVLELMGHLVSHYRRHASGARRGRKPDQANREGADA